MNIGRNVWGNAPEGSAPVDEIEAWLDEMKRTANGWKPDIQANNATWENEIDTLVNGIDAFASDIVGDVFLSRDGVTAYNELTGQYQALKDRLTLSKDFYLSQWQQDLNNPDSAVGGLGALLEKLFAILGAAARSVLGGAGIVIGSVIVIALVYLYVTRPRK